MATNKEVHYLKPVINLKMTLSWHRILKVWGTTKLKSRKIGLFSGYSFTSCWLLESRYHSGSECQHTQRELCKFKGSLFLYMFLQVLDLLDLRWKLGYVFPGWYLLFISESGQSQSVSSFSVVWPICPGKLKQSVQSLFKLSTWTKHHMLSQWFF